MCGCGKSRTATTQNWDHVAADGTVIQVYSSETEARTAAAQQPGTRARRSLVPA